MKNPITIEQKRTMLGRKVNRYLATFAGWCCEANSKQEALDGLIRNLERQAEYNQAEFRLRGTGATWVLSYRNGWQYVIIHDENPNHPSRCMLSVSSHTEAREAMQLHFNQWQADRELLPV